MCECMCVCECGSHGLGGMQDRGFRPFHALHHLICVGNRFVPHALRLKLLSTGTFGRLSILLLKIAHLKSHILNATIGWQSSEMASVIRGW